MSGKNHPIYFIGAGPGHVKYLTLEGREALTRCSLVYAVDPYPGSFRKELEGKTVHDPFERVFEDIVGETEEAGRLAPVGFLVPGDMTVFSPFLPLVEHFRERSRIIAGVGILNAAAALLGRTMDMPAVSHSIVLTSPKYIDGNEDPMELDRLARAAGTLVLYMNNRPLDQLAEELSGGFEPDTPAVILSRVGMTDEKIYRCTLSTMMETVGRDDVFGRHSGEPSLAIVIVGEVLRARSDPASWNRSKEKYWDRKRRGS